MTSGNTWAETQKLLEAERQRSADLMESLLIVTRSLGLATRMIEGSATTVIYPYAPLGEVGPWKPKYPVNKKAPECSHPDVDVKGVTCPDCGGVV